MIGVFAGNLFSHTFFARSADRAPVLQDRTARVSSVTEPVVTPPSVWILADHKLGHTTQSIGLADALGWPCEVKQLRFNRLQWLGNRLLGATLLSLDRRGSQSIDPPFPDLVISTGRAAAPVARWIGKRSLRRSRGRTRLVQMGRRGVHHRTDAFDLSVVCGFFGLPRHAARIETLAPLTAIDDRALAEAAAQWADLFAGAPRPHVALLVGGSSSAHRLDVSTAALMVSRVQAWTRAAGGTLHVVTSPRTGAQAGAAMKGAMDHLGASDRFYEWRPRDPGNPYRGCLAVADILVVTGDSESMIAEAAATTAALYLYPVPARARGPRRRFQAWVAARANFRPPTEAATQRPRTGLDRLCAGLIERGLVRPPRDLAEFHRRLVEAGHAHHFGEPLDATPRRPLREFDVVAARVRTLFTATPSGAGVRA
jgi:mitochondrial fission protein ELM1